MEVFIDLEQLKSLIVIMSRIYDLTHSLVILLALILMVGGLFAVFTQTKRGFGAFGINPHRHGPGLGVSMFFAGTVLAVLDAFIAIFTIQFAADPSPLSTLSAEGAGLVAQGSNEYHVLFIRLLGVYCTYLGYIFCVKGLYEAAGAGSDQISGGKVLFFSFLGGLVLILIGKNMSGYSI